MSKATSNHPAFQTRQTHAKMIRIWRWYKSHKHHRQRIAPCVKNDKCFYSMEPYDKKVNKGPYFYHIQDEKTVFEFDPCLLSTYIDTAKNRRNPFSKVEFNVVELKRIDRLARQKNPRHKRLDIQALVNPVDESSGGDLLSTLRQMHDMITGTNSSLRNILAQPSFTDDIQFNSNYVLTNQPRSDDEVQMLFQQEPSTMMTFLQDQVTLPEEKRDQNWMQFMRALTGLAARRFDRVNNGSFSSNFSTTRQVRVRMPTPAGESAVLQTIRNPPYPTLRF